MSRPGSVALFALLLAALGSAQDSGPVSAVSLLGGSVGLVPEAGGFVGAGPEYKATFALEGVSVTPFLGVGAPHNLPLELKLDSIHRGSEAWMFNSSVRPVAEGTSVVYSRALGVEERYDLELDSVYQSFLLPTLPPGDGDLVVRLHTSTELQFEHRTDGGVTYSASGIGGLVVGAVTGIDARGVAFAGELRAAEGILELVLPAAEVERAALPLLVDPTIGSVFVVAGGSNDDRDPDVAFSIDQFRYLVVWDRRISSTDGDVFGQLVQNGAPVGGLLMLETGAGIAQNPSVGFVRQYERFFVAWQDQQNLFVDVDIRGRAVEASGAMSPTVTVSSDPNNERDPDVGGERNLVGNNAAVVWEVDGVGIRAGLVRVAPGMVGPVGGQPDVTNTTGSVRSPAISQSPDDSGNFAIVWERDFGSGSRIRGRTMLRNAFMTSPIRPISDRGSGTDDLDDSTPDVDTTGDGFLAVWSEEETSGNANHDIEVIRFRADFGDLLFESDVVELENDQNDDEDHAAVAHLMDGTAVVFLDEAAAGDEVRMKIVDPYTGLEAAEYLLGTGVSLASDLCIGSHWSGWSFGTEALCVWDTQGSAQGDLRAIEYELPQNTTAFLSGCGDGGVAVAPNPLWGNSNFRLHLREASLFVPVVVGVSQFSGFTACGACTIDLNFANYDLYLAGLTDFCGNASYSIPIPVGFTASGLTVQWGVFNGGGCPSFGGIDISSAMLVDITAP